MPAHHRIDKTYLALVLALILALILALAVAAPAQTTSFTSPKGFQSTEGNTVFYFSLDRRYQCLDATNLGTVMNLNALALRRDGYLTGGSTGAHSFVDLKVGVAAPLTRIFSNPDRNLVGKPTRVMRKSFQFPDWSVRPTTPPAPFNLVFPFSTPFLYLGARPLVWDMSLSGSNDILPVDRDFDSTAGWGQTIAGTPCGGFKQRLRFGNAGASAKQFGMFLGCSASGAPANATTLLSLDVRKTSLKIPGWCGMLAVAPTVLVPFDRSTATGKVPEQIFASPFDNNVSGAALFGQLAALQAGSVQLSDAAKVTMPTNRRLVGHDAAYLWVPPTGKTADGVNVGGTLVTRWTSN